MKTLFYILCASLWALKLNAASPDNCLLEKYKKYAQTQEKWQQDMTSLILKHAPALEAVANLYMQDQQVRIKKNLRAVELLLLSHSNKIDGQRKLNQWLNLTAADEQIFAAEDTRYAELLLSVSKSNLRKAHSDADQLRAVVRLKVAKSPAFTELFSHFRQDVDEIEKKICAN